MIDEKKFFLYRSIFNFFIPFFIASIFLTSCGWTILPESDNSDNTGREEGLPPDKSAVGNRSITLESVSDVQLSAGSYSGKRFTSAVSLATTGAYSFTDCVFDKGIDTVFGGESVTRAVNVNHCDILKGLYFEDGGQKDWIITWSYLRGESQALRPKSKDSLIPTPFRVTDSIIENTGPGSPSSHVEAMQALGGNSMTFIRVRFITPGPYIDNITGQTASINQTSNDSLFDSCEFLTPKAFHYTIYSDGKNVLFRNCRIAKGISGYLYPNSETMADFEGCTDIETGNSIL